MGGLGPVFIAYNGARKYLKRNIKTNASKRITGKKQKLISRVFMSWWQNPVSLD